MADRKISDLTALTTPASGDYLPIVDISEASAANKNKRITIEELLRGAPNGTAGAPGIAFESDPNTGIYSPSADAFGVVTGGTERARIDSSGRLLVGTSTSRTNYPANDFSGLNQIEGAGTLASFGLSITHGSSAGYPASLSLNNHKSNSVGGITATTSGFPTGLIKFKGSDGTNFIDGAHISGAADGNWSSGDCPGRLVFSTTAAGASSPTERLRITSAGVLQIADAGNIAVGTTTGTKIGTATTQKLGFFNKTPVAQPAAVADATDAASVITQLNALLARMRDLGLIAT